MQPAFSPDGERLLFTRAERGTADVWLHDIQAGTSRRVSHSGGYHELGIWFADGRRIAYLGEQGGEAFAWSTAADGSGEPAVFLRMDSHSSVAWSPDGRYFAFTRTLPDSGADLWLADAADPQRSWALTSARGNENGPTFSPDGRWVVYVADPTGQVEVYASRFLDGSPPRLGPAIPLSSGGGLEPRWRADGRELFYLAGGGRIVAVPVNSATETLVTGRPVDLFRIGGEPIGWDVSPDGQRFVVPQSAQPGADVIRLLTNWRRRLP